MCLVKRNHTYYFRRRYPVDVAILAEKFKNIKSAAVERERIELEDTNWSPEEQQEFLLEIDSALEHIFSQ